MEVIFYILIGLVLLFGFVVFFGAPYLPTFLNQQKTALDLLDLKPGQTLLELGSGDGRVMKLAAQRGLHVVGYELNPLLVIVSFFVTWKYREKIKIIWGSFWNKTWPPNDGAYTFLMDKYMAKLDKKIQKEPNKPQKLVSIVFKIPNKKPMKQKNGVYLYFY